MTTEVKPKKWINSIEAAKMIQSHWTHKEFCDFLINRKILSSEDATLGFPGSEENLRPYTFELGAIIYNYTFEVEEDYVQILINEYFKMVEEYHTEEALELERIERSELTEDLEKNIELLKSTSLALEALVKRHKFFYGKD